VTKPEEIPLVNYLPKLVDDLKPAKSRVLNSLAKGIIRLSKLTPSSSQSPAPLKPKQVVMGFSNSVKTTIQTTSQRARHSTLSPRKRAIIIKEDLLPEVPQSYRLKIKGSAVFVNIAYFKQISQICLFVKIYSPDLGESLMVVLTSPADINRLCTIMNAGSKELQEAALGFLLKYEKSWVGGKFGLLVRQPTIEKSSMFKITPKTLKKLLWQVDSQRDILLVFDKLSFTVVMTDAFYGRMLAMCSIFYTFRGHDCYLAVNIAGLGNRNIIFKMVLSKEDIHHHVHPDLMAILFDRGAMIKHLQGFLKKIVFERSVLYTKPIIIYKRSAFGHLQSGFSNIFKKAISVSSYLEKKKIEREVVSQFVLKHQRTFMVATVFRHRSAQQHDIELYFPKTHKRFLFEMFNDELLRMDRLIVNKIFQLSSSEILFLAETSKFDYGELRNAIRENVVVTYNKG
jgi:hypothetical protein